MNRIENQLHKARRCSLTLRVSLCWISLGFLCVGSVVLVYVDRIPLYGAVIGAVLAVIGICVLGVALMASNRYMLAKSEDYLQDGGSMVGMVLIGLILMVSHMQARVLLKFLRR